MNQIDEELIDTVAWEWHKGGGDRDGFVILQEKIADRIQELAKIYTMEEENPK